MSIGSKKKEPSCQSEAKASHSQIMWAEVSSSDPHLLHKGLLVSPIKWRRLLRVLCPVRRPITTLDCVLLKDKSLIFVAGLGPEINFRDRLWALLRSHPLARCRLSIQHFIFLLIFCLGTLKDSLGPENFWTEPSLASLLAVSFPHTPACPGTQYSPTLCPIEISFNTFWHCHTNGDVLVVWKAFRATSPSEQIHVYSVYHSFEFYKHGPR